MDEVGDKYVNQILFALLKRKPKTKIEIFSRFYPNLVKWKKKTVFVCSSCFEELKGKPPLGRITRCKKCAKPLYTKEKPKIEYAFKKSEKYQIIANCHRVVIDEVPVTIQNSGKIIEWFTVTKNRFKKLKTDGIIIKDRRKYSLCPSKIIEKISDIGKVRFNRMEKKFLLYLFGEMCCVLYDEFFPYPLGVKSPKDGGFRYPELLDANFNFLDFICLFFMNKILSGERYSWKSIGKASENFSHLDWKTKMIFPNRKNKELLKYLRNLEMKRLKRWAREKKIIKLKKTEETEEEDLLRCFYKRIYKKLKKISMEFRNEYTLIEELRSRLPNPFW